MRYDPFIEFYKEKKHTLSIKLFSMRQPYYMRHKKFITELLKSMVICLWVIILLPLPTKAAIPNFFLPNYQILDSYQLVLDSFVELEAKKRIWQDPGAAIFSKLNSSFASVFPYLPNNSNYKIVYQQCEILSQNLSAWYTYDKFINFMENCFDPLNRTIKEIGQKYTIKPVIVANPQQWPSPLTVTFDAKKTVDPSNDTIPSDNFYWYYKDTSGADQVLGQGPTVNYTFNTEWTYLVHLTVRSANQQSEGILDGNASTSISVGPQSASLVVYANNKKLSETITTKLSIQEAQRGIKIDWAASQARWGRTILSHQWKVLQWNNIVQQSDLLNWNPWSFSAILQTDGQYSVELLVNDNENNSLKKNFLLNISDPIAQIKQLPAIWDTQTNFKFDWSASYSINSTIRLYTWELFNELWDKLFTTQKKEFSQTFLSPWTYSVKLTVEDERGEINEEIVKFFVESSKPLAQYSITPTNERKYPSQYILDASLSSDYDVVNNVDNLSYDWFVSDPENTIITEAEEWNKKKIYIAFNNIWDQKVKLIVSDSYGKTSEIEKNIKVESALRPNIIASPNATTRWNPITFAVTANKNIINYEWDFGDNTTRIIQTNTVQYTYKKAGIYKVKLVTTDSSWDENEIVTDIFVGEQNKPTIIYKVTDRSQNIIKQNSQCVDDKGQTHDAYEIERQSEFIIDSTSSVNVKWRSQWLITFFSPQDEEIFTNNRFNYRFRSVWCKFVSITLQDTESTEIIEDKVWFRVINALPSLENISLFFPQFGNEIGIGLDQNKVQNIFEGENDELIVKVIAHKAEDLDWQISTFTWYYYNKDDPNRLLEVKANPGNVPYAFFTLSKSALRWDFAFGVRMTDNDGWEITSEEIIGFWPSLFFLPQGSSNIDIPIVTVRTSTVNTKVWEEVSFEVVSKVLSNRADFEAARSIEYDFGDWSDKIRTKKAKITHIYESAWKFTPKITVTYRSNPWIAYWETINVENALKANIIISSYDKIVMLRDFSMWEIESSFVCFDRTKCNIDWMTQKNQKEYIKKYADYWQYVIEYNVVDKFWNSATERRLVDITPPATNKTVKLLTIPESKVIDWKETIRVGWSLNNEIMIFVNYISDWLCYIDTNIARDEDGDGISDNDKTMTCNSPKIIKYSPELWESLGRIYYEERVDGFFKLKTLNYTVDFIDFESVLTDGQKEIYFVLNDLINSLDDNYLGNAIIKDELINIRDNIQNPSEVSLSLIWIDDYMNDDSIAEKEIVMSDLQARQLEMIQNELTSADVLLAQWASIYYQSKQTILQYTPSNLYSDVQNIFWMIEKIEEPAKEPEIIKGHLQSILTKLLENAQWTRDDTNTSTIITQEEIDLIVVPSICKILSFYTISSSICPNDDWVVIDEELSLNEVASSGLVTILKWIWIIVLVLGWIFVTIVIFFAIRSRVKQDQNVGGVPTA